MTCLNCGTHGCICLLRECPICDLVYHKDNDNFCSDCGWDFSVKLKDFANDKWDYVIPVEVKEKKKIYISGSMHYKKNFNFKAFIDAEKKLKDMGFIVYNPARNPLGIALKELMQIDMMIISQYDAIYMLNGYENSSGAIAELTYAKMLGLEVYDE